jgi:RIO kinase 2
MKLDPTVMRSMTPQEYRVLEAVETCMRTHALVPLALLSATANLRHGGSHKLVSILLRDKLLSHERNKKQSVDGYRLTTAGYDVLALRHLVRAKCIAALGPRIGTGKESDVYLAVDPAGKQVVLKLHRLGRTSFRNVRNKRDYFNNKQSKTNNQAHSWLFLSRLSALKEYAFMRALYDAGYSTPTPIAHNRHVVAMSLVRGIPLYQIVPKSVQADQALSICEQAMTIAKRLAVQHGLVHCDLNEFNLLVDLSGIQALATDPDDAYVRHSGAASTLQNGGGTLSKPAWEQSLEPNDLVEEAVPEPVARLPSGRPRPVVTLIDFPQMISIGHPNAQDYYERDVACLRRFFELKLQCDYNDTDLQQDDFSWEHIVSCGVLETNNSSTRLDRQLRASGSNETALNHDLVLYYFESVARPESSVVQEVDREEDDSSSNNSVGEESNDDFDPSTSNEDAKHEMETSSFELDNNDDPVDEDDDAGTNPRDVVVVELEDQFQNLMAVPRNDIYDRAKANVRKQMDEQKRKNRKHGALRTGNSNKTYVKGKRVMTDCGM